MICPKHISLVLLLLLFNNCVNIQADRSLSYQLNPDCNKSCQNLNSTFVAHVQSTGDNSTYHYVWAFVSGFKPSILMVETDHSANLTIDWDKVVSKDKQTDFLSFINGTVYNSFGVEFSNIFFTDGKTNETIYSLPFELMPWKLKSSTSKDSMQFEFYADNSTVFNGTVILKFSAFSSPSRSGSTPHLLYTDSANLFELTLDGLDFDFNSTNSKNETVKPTALCDFTIAYESEYTRAHLQEDISFDDEYTPGIFKRYVYDIRSMWPLTKTNVSSYIEWKPVAYYDSTRVIAKSIQVVNPSIENISLLDPSSFLHGYFVSKQFKSQYFSNLKFGSSDDDFEYTKNRYIFFSLVLGLNQAPEELFSGTLKIIIIVGLGVPMLLFVVSIIYTIIRKVRSGNNYDGLNDIQ